MLPRSRSAATLPGLGIIIGSLILAANFVAGGGYVLSKSYMGEDFFSHFTFFHSKDLSAGHVEYVDYQTALSEGLIKATHDWAYIGAEMAKPAPLGRRSVRVHSTATYNKGLFVVSVDHIPTGCGTWPAFWMYGEDTAHIWPTWGEYDIIESVHGATSITTSLHTGLGCDQSAVAAGSDFTGSWVHRGTKADNCDIHAPDQAENQGCSQQGPVNSAGATFNQHGGGTYAAEWDPAAGHFRTWFFPRGQEPPDLLRGQPVPDLWGKPFSYFTLAPESCPTSHFKNMRLVFNVDFCGYLGESLYREMCPDIAEGISCTELVSNHPERFAQAYWSIRKLDVYQKDTAAAVTEELRQEEELLRQQQQQQAMQQGGPPIPLEATGPAGPNPALQPLYAIKHKMLGILRGFQLQLRPEASPRARASLSGALAVAGLFLLVASGAIFTLSLRRCRQDHGGLLQQQQHGDQKGTYYKCVDTFSTPSA